MIQRRGVEKGWVCVVCIDRERYIPRAAAFQTWQISRAGAAGPREPAALGTLAMTRNGDE